MHGKKKWVLTWLGRVKRSRHRTQQDWQGELGCESGRDRLIGYGRKRRKCPQCTALQKDKAWFLYSRSAECRSCRRKHDVAWRLWHTGGERRNYMPGPPADFRRDIERSRRSAYRNHMQRAKYVPELYDTVPARYPKDAAWRYW